MKKTSYLLAISLAVLLSACGKQESAPPAATAPAAAPPAAVPEAASPAPAVAEKHDEAGAQPEGAGNELGKKVFGNVCSMCHASGAAGAPKFGNKDEWAPRIAQGMDVLYKHALGGFTGKKGQMPARGGSPKLTDDEVKAAVNYMVDKAK